MLVYVYIMSGGEHTVMIRVFDGGDGWTSGGRSERSSESGDLLPDDAREREGDGMVTCMFAVASMCVECRGSVCVSCCWCEWKSSAETIAVLYQACSGVGTFQLPHPSCSRVALLGGSASTPRPTSAVRILEPPAGDGRLLALGLFRLGCLAQPANLFACIQRVVVFRSCVGRRAARFGYARGRDTDAVATASPC